MASLSMHHLIVGGGPAAVNAIETIRNIDGGESRITLICDEPAHSRMALPYWLAGKIPREHILTADEAYFRRLGVEARIGARVERIDPESKALSLAGGETLSFDDLLIATGSSALKPLFPGAELPGVQPLWRLSHTADVLAATAAVKEPKVVLIGAGFIGFIVLSAMYKRGWRLAVVEREAQVLPRMLDAEAAALVEDWLIEKGVAIHTGASVEAIHAGSDRASAVELDDGRRIDADLVIVATGVQPNLDCIVDSGIETEAGILVDERMRTRFPFIYAGGDVAQGPVYYSRDREVHAIQPTAVDHGRVAGANMAGLEVRYPGSLLMNVLDVCGLQCASFGNWANPAAEPLTIANVPDRVYRSLRWTGDEITGAIFVGRANDLGMLNDVGMVKGLMQTRTPLGPWKAFLQANPFDIRRPYVAAGVAKKLAETTLLGQPSESRRYRFRGIGPQPAVGAAHAVFINATGD